MKKLYIFLVFLTTTTTVCSQTWWDNYCNGETSYLVENRDLIKQVMTSSSDLTEKSEAHLLTAWGMYHQRIKPDTIIKSLYFLMDSIITKNQRSEPIQNLLAEKCFLIGFRTLLDSLRNMDMSAHGYSQQKVAELKSILTYLDRLLPESLKTCVDISFNVTDNNRSVEFIIRIKDCKAELDKRGIPRGRIGYPDIYKALADWYEHSVLAGLGKSLANEKQNTTIEIKGLADGYLVLNDIQLGRSIDIPNGFEYFYMGPNRVSTKAKMNTNISSCIYLSSKSNEYLALSRAYLAYKELSKIASKSLIVAQEFSEKGDAYRGVEIKLTARGILDDLTQENLKYTKRIMENQAIDDLEYKTSKFSH